MPKSSTSCEFIEFGIMLNVLSQHVPKSSSSPVRSKYISDWFKLYIDDHLLLSEDVLSIGEFDDCAPLNETNQL
jgi:hypothetical protein